MYVKKWVVWVFGIVLFLNSYVSFVLIHKNDRVNKELRAYQIERSERDRLYANSIVDLEERFQESEKKKREGKFLKDLIKILSVL